MGYVSCASGTLIYVGTIWRDRFPIYQSGLVQLRDEQLEGTIYIVRCLALTLAAS